MGFNLEVKYYNSFWLKQVTTPLVFNNSGLVPKYVKLFPSHDPLFKLYSAFAWGQTLEYGAVLLDVVGKLG